MPAVTIQLVCFDIGGVLIRLCDGWHDARRRAGVDKPVGGDDFHRHPAFVEANELFDIGRITEGEYSARLAAATGLSADVVMAMRDAWLLEPYPGFDRLLDRLHSTGVETACLSNTNDAHWRTMTEPGGPRSLPLDRLHHRFASQLIGHRKPDPAIYSHVQHQTATDAGGVLFFDDSPANCLAAIEQGWNAYRIDPYADPIAQVTDHLGRYGVL